MLVDWFRVREDEEMGVIHRLEDGAYSRLQWSRTRQNSVDLSLQLANHTILATSMVGGVKWC